MHSYLTPGVHKEEVFPVPPAELRTGVPVFLGFVGDEEHVVPPANQYLGERSIVAQALIEETRAPSASQYLGERSIVAQALIKEMRAHQDHAARRFVRWAEFEEAFGALWHQSYLPHAVRGFFENGGSLCYVYEVHLDQGSTAVEALKKELEALETLEDVDLVCAPDIMWPRQGEEQLPVDRVLRMQSEVLKHCRKCGDRFAILDTPPELGVGQAQAYPQELRQTGEPDWTNAALYYPWVGVLDGPLSTDRFVPPCGHVAGIYARTDEQSGVHKAPANEVLEDVLDLRIRVSDVQQGRLNPEGVNCLRAFPGRGIRVWGARTLSTSRAWRYINVRRLFLTAARWIERNMTGVVFESHDASLWERIKRDLYVYFERLFRQGALKGRTPQEAFYIKCDADLNPPEVREVGHIVTEIGLAPALPNEFIVVRLIHSSSGITLTGPTHPGG